MVKHTFSNTYKIDWIELRNITPFKVKKGRVMSPQLWPNHPLLTPGPRRREGGQSRRRKRRGVAAA